MLVRIVICLALLGAAMTPLMVATAAYAVTMDDVRTARAEKRPFDAFQYLKELAGAGNPEAQYELAGRLVYGDGVFFLTAGFPDFHNMGIRPDGTGDVTGTHVLWHEKKVPARIEKLPTGRPGQLCIP